MEFFALEIHSIRSNFYVDVCHPGFNDIGVVAIMKHCQHLESLSLGSGWEGRLTNLSAVAIAKSAAAKNMIRLSMRYYSFFDGFNIEHCFIYEKYS